MINDEYLLGVAKLMTGETYNIPSYMAFGSDSTTISAADEVISGEFERNPLDSSESSLNVAKFLFNRSSAVANNEYINVVGLHNSSSGSGNLMAAFAVSSLLHTSDFDVDIEYWVRHQRA